MDAAHPGCSDLGPKPLPARLSEISPWIDARFMGPLQPILDRLDAQRHRRFIKSHLAVDGLRFFPQAKYIVVGRDTRDVFMSLFNHYSSYTDMMFELFNDSDRPGPEFPRCPATPGELPLVWAKAGWFGWESDGWPFWSHHHHLSTWWAIRERPNVLFVHFGDLKADPQTEMRRIAEFCAIDVSEDSWPARFVQRSDSTPCATKHATSMTAWPWSGRAAQTASSTRATAVDGAWGVDARRSCSL